MGCAVGKNLNAVISSKQVLGTASLFQTYSFANEIGNGSNVQISLSPENDKLRLEQRARERVNLFPGRSPIHMQQGVSLSRCKLGLRLHPIHSSYFNRALYFLTEGMGNINHHTFGDSVFYIGYRH